MKIFYAFVGLIFVMYGIWSLRDLLINPDTKSPPFSSFDLSVKIGAIGAIIFGLFMIIRLFIEK